jgi:hypothetical protein
MVTHEVLRAAKTSDINVLHVLESRFSSRDSQLTGADIEKKIKMIRGFGVSTLSHENSDEARQLIDILTISTCCLTIFTCCLMTVLPRATMTF